MKLVLCLMVVFGSQAFASVAHFPDGVKIGPDATGDERLPIYDADEWVASITIGTLAGGEVKDFVVSDVGTARAGASVLKARPLNPFSSNYHYNDLDVVNTDVTTTGEITMRVRNRSGSSVNFGGDQWVFSYINTVTPSITQKVGGKKVRVR